MLWMMGRHGLLLKKVQLLSSLPCGLEDFCDFLIVFSSFFSSFFFFFYFSRNLLTSEDFRYKKYMIYTVNVDVV